MFRRCKTREVTEQKTTGSVIVKAVDGSTKFHDNFEQIEK